VVNYTEVQVRDVKVRELTMAEAQADRRLPAENAAHEIRRDDVASSTS